MCMFQPGFRIEILSTRMQDMQVKLANPTQPRIMKSIWLVGFTGWVRSLSLERRAWGKFGF